MSEARIWVLQRAAGLLLIPLVLFHLFDKAGVIAAWVGVELRYTMVFLLLFSLILHGFFGLRSILYDYIHNLSFRRWTDRALVIAGLLLFSYGSWGLWLLLSRG